jgi:hypothetical protein
MSIMKIHPHLIGKPRASLMDLTIALLFVLPKLNIEVTNLHTNRDSDWSILYI